MNKFLVVLSLGLTAVFTAQVSADIVQFSDLTDNAVSSTDLLTGLVAGTDHDWAGAFNQINDGVQAAAFGENAGNNAAPAGATPQRAGATAADTYTFSLDTSVNTLGYDISSVDIFSAWTDGRAGHDIDLLFSTDGGSSFTSVINSVLNTGSGEFVSTRIDDTDGDLLGTGVTDVQFVVRAGGNVGGGTVFREIDVNGIATTAVPEPSSVFVLAGFGLALLRRRK